MAVDKKMAEKASQQRYVGMAAILKEQKKKEKQETEDILKNMERRYAENEQKLEQLRVEQKEDRSMIEKLGDSYMRMSVDYKSEGISEALWEKLGEKLDKIDRDKNDYILQGTVWQNKGFKERPGLGEPDWHDKNILEMIQLG